MRCPPGLRPSPRWGALGAAIWAGLTARRLYAIEAQRDLVAEYERRSLQAQGVAVWCAAEMREGERKPVSWGLVVQNSSNDMIYDLRISSTRKAWIAGVQGPAENAEAFLTVLPPGTLYLQEGSDSRRVWEFAKDIRHVGNEVRPITISPSIKVRSFSFRDSANRTWSRTNSGELTLLES